MLFGSYIIFLFLIFFFLSNNLIVGLQKILALLESEDANVRIHAVKVVANLAAEGKLGSLSPCFQMFAHMGYLFLVV